MDNLSEYKVLKNEEDQHSLWPGDKDAPLGWEQVGPVGDKDACMAFINENWSDITPVSERKA